MAMAEGQTTSGKIVSDDLFPMTGLAAARPPEKRLRISLRLNKTRTLVAGLTLLFMAAGLLAGGWLLWVERRAALDTAQHSTETLVHALAPHYRQVLDDADAVLVAARAAASHSDLADATALADLGAQLDRLVARRPQIARIAVYNSLGEPVAQAMPAGEAAPDGATSRIDPTLYRGLDTGLGVAPVASPDGQSTVALARRFNDGVVVATIAVDAFLTPYRMLDPRPGALLLLLRDDATTLVRDPPIADQAPRREIDLGRLAAGKTAGTVETSVPSDGIARIVSFERLAGKPAYLFAGMAREEALLPWRDQLIPQASVIGTVFLLLGVVGLAAYHVAGNEDRDKAVLWNARNELEVEVRQRTAELEASIVKLSTVADERELLFRDLNHRIRNDLQLISSLLSLQANRLDDAQARGAFEESLERVNSIALVHDLLYSTPGAAVIDVASLMRVLCDRLVTVFRPDGGVVCTVSAASAEVSIDVAIRLGLIVNEVLSNVLKHSFSGGRNGTITVTFRAGERMLKLTVTDDGAGPSMTTSAGETRLGVQLCDLLARNLSAVVLREQLDNCHKFELSLPA
jgi:two-component sensor histidine kinase